MARVSLIYLDINTGHFPGLHNGLASLTAVLRKKGHTVCFHHLSKEEPPDAFADAVLADHPDAVGFSLTTTQRRYLEQYSQSIFRRNRVLQIAGGVHATVDPMDVFTIPSIRGVCIGEAEQTLSVLLERLDAAKPFFDVAGFWWRTEAGEIRQNAVPPLEADLSKLPFPDYSVFDLQKINGANGNWMAMMVTRGCPYDCSYCCNHVLRYKYPNPKNYVRVPPVEHALGVIKNNLLFYPGTKGIIFIDDLLAMHKEWFTEFMGRYRKEIKLPFTCNLRVEYIDEALCSVLKESGCVLAQLGIESGNEWLRTHVLNRKMSNAQIENAFRLLRKAGLATFTYNIMGFPFETPEFMKETLSLNKRIKANSGMVYYFFPYPGTRLYAICQEYGLLSSSRGDFSGMLEGPGIKLTHCKIQQCKKIYNKLILYLFSRWATKHMKRGSSFVSGCFYIVFNTYPSFFVNLFTKGSKLRDILRRVAYRKFFVK